MNKGLIASIALVFFLTPIALSNIGQAENIQINTENLLSLLGGPKTAIGGTTISIGQNQIAATPGLDFEIVFQSEIGIVNQGTTAVSYSAIIGQQTQTGNEQEQNWAGNLEQNVNKNNGIGGIAAGQGMALGQVQITANNNGIQSNANISGAVQLNGLVGGPGLDVIIQKYMAVGTGQ